MPYYIVMQLISPSVMIYMVYERYTIIQSPIGLFVAPNRGY